MWSWKMRCMWLSKWRTNSGGGVGGGRTPYLGLTGRPNVMKKKMEKLFSTKSKTENTQEATIHGSEGKANSSIA